MCVACRIRSQGGGRRAQRRISGGPVGGVPGSGCASPPVEGAGGKGDVRQRRGRQAVTAPQRWVSIGALPAKARRGQPAAGLPLPAQKQSRGCCSSRRAGVVPRDKRDWCTGGWLTEKCSHHCLPWGWCRNAASPSGTRGAADVVGGLGKCHRARNVRGSEQLRLQRAGVWAGSPSPPAAPAGSTSWMAQPGFPEALVPFQLPLLWQPIPLLSGWLARG